jgi:hypothetical protein
MSRSGLPGGVRVFRAVALVGVAVVCALAGVAMVHDQHDLDRHGVVAEAQVIRVNTVHRPRSTDRYLDVVIPGLPGTFEVSEYDSDVRAGDGLALRYMPDDPATNEEVGHDVAGFAWLVWLIAATAAVLAVLDLREGTRRRLPRRLTSTGRGRRQAVATTAPER